MTSHLLAYARYLVGGVESLAVCLLQGLSTDIKATDAVTDGYPPGFVPLGGCLLKNRVFVGGSPSGASVMVVREMVGGGVE